MEEVTLHVYDVTNSGNVRANSAIMNLNKLMRGGIGLGGIFHGAVEVRLFADYLVDALWDTCVLAYGSYLSGKSF